MFIIFNLIFIFIQVWSLFIIIFIKLLVFFEYYFFIFTIIELLIFNYYWRFYIYNQESNIKTINKIIYSFLTKKTHNLDMIKIYY